MFTPITQSAAPHIEVTITPALRALVTDQRIRARCSATHQPVASGRSGAEVTALNYPWQVQRLRRDGQRPLKFEGLQIAGYRTPVLMGQTECEQRVAVYVSRSNRIFVALALIAPRDAPLRSVHDASPLAAQPPSPLLAAWCRKIGNALGLLALSSHPADCRAQIQNAIRSITSLNLQSELSPCERKPT